MFEQWGTCERTVVACALARRVPWPGLRLLQRAVEAALQNHVEDERLERDANDEALLAKLLAARGDDDDEEGTLICLLARVESNGENSIIRRFADDFSSHVILLFDPYSSDNGQTRVIVI